MRIKSLSWACLSCLLWLNWASHAQELPEVIPPSPTVANLMQFEEVPVSYYTGQPNISIPIYSKALNGDLAVNIGLSYNTQSIKINNRSGWTGTGWSLNAGGVISRTVRGLPDEMVRNSGFVTGEGVFHIDDYWNYNSLTMAQKQKFMWRAGGTPSDKYDHESDLFQFNILGVSGRFVIVRQGSTLVPKLLSKNQNIVINIYTAGGPDPYQLDKFTITDTKGYVYTFDIKEEMHSFPVNAVTYFDENTSLANGGNYVSTNAWHLSKIEMPNSVGGNLTLATFTYQNSFEAYTASVSRTYARPINHDTSLWNDLMAVPYNPTVTKPKETFAYYTTSGTTKKLDRITFRDGTYVEFDLKAGGFSHPETGGDALEYIRIKDAANIENKHFRLIYDSNISNRLWLDEIQEVAGGITNPYTLEYNDKHGLPAFDTVSVTDDWGYHKGSSTGTCGLVIPDNTAIQKGLLERIIYPTGGSKEFEFERHTITYQGSTQLSDNEYRDKNPDNWVPQQLSLSYNSATDNSAQFPSLLPDTFIVSQAQTLSYKLLSTTASTSEKFNAFIEVKGPNSYREVFRLTENEVQFPVVDSGTYEVRFYTLDLGTSYTVTACIGYKNFVSNIKRYVYGGGVRIKSIVFKDNPIDVNSEKEILFQYDELDAQNTSTGAIDGLLDGLVRVHTETNARYYLWSPCPINAMSGTAFDFEVRTQALNAELTQGQYIGYKTVKVYETGNGYNQYTYTSAQDYASPASVFTYPYSPADDIDYKRGLLLRQETFNQAGDTLQAKINTYAFEESVIAPSYKLHYEDCIVKMFYDYYDDYFANSPNNRLLQCNVGTGCQADCLSTPEYANCGVNLQKPYRFESNDVKATWAKLTQTETKDYFYEGGTQTVKTSRQEFLYNATNYQISQQDTYYDKSGTDEHLQTKFYYPVGASLNSNTTGIMNSLVSVNKVNEVLEQQVFRNGTKISETHTIYDVFYSDLILPKEVKTGKGTQTPETRIEFHAYDTYGNPLEVSKTDGTHISYIYGFNKALPVAKLSNATYSAIEGVLGSGFTLTGNLSAAQETSLRNGLPNALISVYRYDPIKGVTSTEDDKGYTMTFEYDALNRLETVKDADGNIVGKNAYNYKNQY